MTTYYVKAGTGGTGGLSWADAFNTLVQATGAATPTVIYVASTHTETTAGDVLLSLPLGPGNATVAILSVTEASPPTTLTAGAVIECTGNTAIEIDGNVYMYGMTLNGSTDNNSSSAVSLLWHDSTSGDHQAVYENCTINAQHNRANGTHSFGTTSSAADPTRVYFNGCTFSAFNVGHDMLASKARVYLSDCVFSSGQDNWFRVGTGGEFHISGCSFNAQLAGDALVLADAGSGQSTVSIVGSSYNAGTIMSGVPSTSLEVNVSMSDVDGDTQYNIEKHTSNGVLLTDTTYVRSGGASDGTTAVSWKLDSETEANVYNPFYTPWIQGVVTATGSKTFTCHVLHSSATELKTDEAWLEVESLGTASRSTLSRDTSRNANLSLGTPADLTASTETWSGSLANENKSQLAVTQTVNEVGPFRARVAFTGVGAVNTLYVCPKIVVS
jgi:hypothetical protein